MGSMLSFGHHKNHKSSQIFHTGPLTKASAAHPQLTSKHFSFHMVLKHAASWLDCSNSVLGHQSW